MTATVDAPDIESLDWEPDISQSGKHRHSAQQQLTDHLPGAVTCGLLAMIAGYRALVIGLHGSPSGVDFGNWLMLGHQWLGDRLPDSPNVTYPPLIPLLAVFFSHVFGVLWGNALLAAIAGVAPAIGGYVAVRMCGARWASVPAAFLLAATSSTGEAVAWGGLPQLVGLGLAAAVAGAAVRALQRGTWRSAALLGFLLLGVGLTSHLVYAQAAVAVVLVIVLRMVTDRRALAGSTWWGQDGWVNRAAIIAAPSLILVPLYLDLLSTVGKSFVVQDQVSAGWPAFYAFVQNLGVIRRDSPWLWGAALLATAALPFLLGRRRHRKQPLWSVTVALLVTTVAPGLVSGQSRLVYFAPLAVGFALAFVLAQLAGLRNSADWKSTVATIVVVALVGAVGWSGGRGLAFFPTQRAYYGAFVPRGSVAGLDWLRHNTPASALVAVAPIDGSPFGWWVQGLGRRSALVGSEDQWLNFPAERERAQESVALFTAANPLGPTVLEHARQLGVGYLVIPWLWGGLTQGQLAAFEVDHPGAQVFDNNALVIVEVPK